MAGGGDSGTTRAPARRRIACAVVPDLPLVAALRAEPALAGSVLAVTQGAHAGAPVLAASPEALAFGILPGLTAAQARARCPKLVLRPASEAAARAAHGALLDAACSLSPSVEDGGPGIAFLDASGLHPAQLRAEAGGAEALATPEEARAVHPPGARDPLDAEGVLTAALRARTCALGVPAQVGVASCKAVARLVAHRDLGPLAPQDEPAFLAAYPVEAAGASPLVAATLARWGVRTLGALAALPRDGLSDRLGPEGVRLHRLAHGELVEPLSSIRPPPRVEEAVDLEYGAERLEPILFVLRPMLERVLERLGARAMACAGLILSLRLAPSGRDERRIAPAAPTLEVGTLFTLARLELETRPPAAPVRGWTLYAEATPAVRHPRSLFDPPAPEPDRLAETLARLCALVGAERVGAPAAVDGWRPEAAAMAPFAPPRSAPSLVPSGRAPPMCARRLFRPALPATVRLLAGRPAWVQSDAVSGRIVRAQGPTRVSAAWWEPAPIARDYYDVQVEREGVFRLFQEHGDGSWYLDAEYD